MKVKISKMSISDVNNSYYSSDPNDHNKTFETWDELFDFQARKDGANYRVLKDWLKKFCEVPKLKTKSNIPTPNDNDLIEHNHKNKV